MEKSSNGIKPNENESLPFDERKSHGIRNLIAGSHLEPTMANLGCARTNAVVGCVFRKNNEQSTKSSELINICFLTCFSHLIIYFIYLKCVVYNLKMKLVYLKAFVKLRYEGKRAFLKKSLKKLDDYQLYDWYRQFSNNIILSAFVSYGIYKHAPC